MQSYRITESVVSATASGALGTAERKLLQGVRLWGSPCLDLAPAVEIGPEAASAKKDRIILLRDRINEIVSRPVDGLSAFIVLCGFRAVMVPR